jgi:predicted NBD/HSP70 family sugar kinase
LYIFVDTFIGGGLVLDSRLRGGLAGNAGAVGSMPLWPAGQGPDHAGTPPQLLSVASLLSLERAFATAGLDSGAATDERALRAPWLPTTQAWLETAAAAMAQSIVSSACLLDIDSVILDGSFSRELLAALLEATGLALSRYDWEGVSRPPLQPGTIGSDARALGGALLPLHANFSANRDLFIKLGPREG